MHAPSDPAERTGIRLPPLVIFAAGVAAGTLIGHFSPMPIPGGRMLTAVGVLWMVAGLAVMSWALVTFRRAGTTFNPFGGSTAVVVRGPYRYTRNPMYVGLLAACIGVALTLREAWILIALLPVVVVIDRHVICREERYLERRFGAAWHAYAARVRRWL
jgi:protein-S-isoprenylcysteine O-methyltransferase Ste14